MDIWGSLSIQIAWFLTSVEGVKADAVFEAVFEEEPEQVHKNRNPNPAAPHLSVATGRVGELTSTVSVQPGRVDIVVAPFGAAAEEEDTLPLIDTAEIISFIQGRVQHMAKVMPNCTRMALVANCGLPVSSYNEGMDHLWQAIGFHPHIDDSSDFIFQINKRGAGESGAALNRILRYAITSMQDVIVDLSGGTQIPVRSELIAATVTYDVNSVPGVGVIESHNLQPIFDDIVRELIRLAAAGKLSALK